jgi:hypothetical protein
MDPRTFLPPRGLPLAAIPQPGSPAPARPAVDGPAVVAFLRHAGCPFAEATMHALREAAEATPAVRFVAVSHAPADATGRWCEAVGGTGSVELVVDDSRELYAAWGLGRGSLGHVLGRRSLGAVSRLAREGIRNRHPSGTRWQMAGTFALDAGRIVRWVHVPAHAGDLPDLSAAAAAAG